MLLLIFICPVVAKCQFNIKGKVLNPSGEVLAGVSVTLNSGVKFIKSTITDQYGVFILSNQTAGFYTIKCSAIGFTDTITTCNLAQDTVFELKLRRSIHQLKEVQVTTQRQLIEKKIDRTIFNVENSIAAAGSDALELMGKIPGVRVANNTISLIGKGSVSVMVNDRLIHLSADDLFTYLKSISSDNISKIEIITNPPAKYDAQGNNGLINILLKKPTNEGLQGSVSENYSLASYPTFASGADVNYRNKNLTVTSNFSIRNGSVYPEEKAEVMYPNQTWDIVNRYRNFRKVLSGQLGIDYQLSKKVLVGGLYNGSHTDFHSYEKITTSIYQPNQNLDSVLLSQANAKINSSFRSANLFLKQQIDSNGTLLLVNADWFSNTNNSRRYFNNNTYINGDQLREGSFAQYLSESDQNVDVYTIKADADIPCKLFKLSMGSKLSFIQNISHTSFYKELNGQYLIDQHQTNNFDYHENTQALYFNLHRAYKKWSIQTGLRGEYTQTRGISWSSNQTDINRYLRLFPTAYLSYQLDELHVFSFSYGKRINRPPYKDLNPFRWYSNQYAYMEGNPFLKPSYSNNFELSHTYKSFIITALSYSHTSNGYSNINFTDTLSRLQVTKPTNFITAYNYQWSNFISFTKINWLQSNNEFDVIYNRSASSIQGTLPSLSALSAYFSTSNEIYFVKDKTLSAELSFWYQLKNADGLVTRASQYNLNAGAKILLFKKHVQLAASLTDLLKSNEYRDHTVINNIKQAYANYYDSRQLRLSLRYVFGNQKVKQQNHQTGNTEETKRNK